MNLKLETERLTIIPYNDNYINDYYNEFTDEIVKYQYPDSFSDIESAKSLVSSFVSNMKNGSMLELVILSKDGEFIGSIQAFGLKEPSPEVGLWLKSSAHGHGYGYEALSAVINYLNSLKDYPGYIYEVDKRNKPSIKLVEKFNYEKGDCEEITTESGKKLYLIKYLIK